MDKLNPNLLCEHLKKYHTGRKNAAPSKMLEAVFHIGGREIRRCVNTLRCEGHPICSSNDGYYYAARKEELGDTVTMLSSLINEVSKARNGLLFSAKSLPDESTIQINIILNLEG